MDKASKIAGMTSEEILMKIEDAGVRADVLRWARLNDPLCCAVHKSTRHLPGWSEHDQIAAMAVVLICEKVKARDRLLELYQNLKPADVLLVKPDPESRTQ